MNKAGIVHRKDAESAKGQLILGFERQKPLPIFRCFLWFPALSAESHKKIYLSVLCVSAVNYCNIFKCIVPLTPQVTPQVTPQATMQDERIKKIVEFCGLPRSREEIQIYLNLKNRDYLSCLLYTSPSPRD